MPNLSLCYPIAVDVQTGVFIATVNIANFDRRRGTSWTWAAGLTTMTTKYNRQNTRWKEFTASHGLFSFSFRSLIRCGGGISLSPAVSACASLSRGPREEKKSGEKKVWGPPLYCIVWFSSGDDQLLYNSVHVGILEAT